MRSSLLRHLGSVLVEEPGQLSLLERHSLQAKGVRVIPPELAPRDYVAYLLTIDAEIEHALMDQYLYAAYSLGGPQVPLKHQDMVANWQRTILGVAREEMGHLISVQNVLRLIGAPLALLREDSPWDSPFYPFPFRLEPASINTIARYVFAESPPLDEWRGELQEEVLKRIDCSPTTPKRVGALFELLIDLVQDQSFLEDNVFQAETRPFQADFSEWGRGNNGMQGRADVIVSPVASRDQAVEALNAIASQGEAMKANLDDENPSHFARFCTVFEQMLQAEKEGWSPSRPVATDPYVPLQGSSNAEGVEHGSTQSGDPITHPVTQIWAHLFNIRYRLLLQLIAHSFELAGGLVTDGSHTPRGVVIHSTFGEMYNIRALGQILVQAPLNLEGDRCAGPPFLMPYTLDLPVRESDRWRVHLDLLQASERLVEQLLAAGENPRYLATLRQADRELAATINALLSRR
jgi:hypothetical protein